MLCCCQQMGPSDAKYVKLRVSSVYWQGLRAEFLPQDAVGDLSVPSSTGGGALYVWRLVNGFWGLVSAAHQLIPDYGGTKRRVQGSAARLRTCRVFVASVSALSRPLPLHGMEA